MQKIICFIALIEMLAGFPSLTASSYVPYGTEDVYKTAIPKRLPRVPMERNDADVYKHRKISKDFLTRHKITTFKKLKTFIDREGSMHEGDLIHLANSYRTHRRESILKPTNLALASFIYNQIIQKYDTSFKAKALSYLGLAKISGRQNNLDEASIYLDLALKISPECSSCLLFKAVLQRLKA